MRLKVRHDTSYRYATPALSVIQTLRLTPRAFSGLYVIDWRIMVDADCRLTRLEDAFGNITHTFTTDEPLDSLTVSVEGEVETSDDDGVITGTPERFPPGFFLRSTELSRASPAMVAFAREATGKSPLDRLHALMGRLHGAMTFDTSSTHVATAGADAFAQARGVCQDYTHAFIGMARALGIPARYVSGYFHRADGVVEQDAAHAWAEAYVDHLGWVGFDPANAICPTDQHVRVAIGLDYLGAAPVRGTRYGGASEILSVDVHVDQAGRQVQS